MTARHPRVLLLQVRNRDDPMIRQELECFRRRLAPLPPEQVRTCSLLLDRPGPGVLEGVDAVMIGGSGDYSCVDNRSEWFLHACGFLRELVAREVPLFASCWGIQHLTVALGGEVAPAGPDLEVGTFEVSLTPEGRTDPLFGTLPERFWAQLGHKDRVVKPPPGARVLASSPRCPVQAFRLDGRPVYATQFHPELTREENLERMKRYRHCYQGAGSFRALLEGFRESPCTAGLLRRFLEGLR